MKGPVIFVLLLLTPLGKAKFWNYECPQTSWFHQELKEIDGRKSGTFRSFKIMEMGADYTLSRYMRKHQILNIGGERNRGFELRGGDLRGTYSFHSILFVLNSQDIHSINHENFQLELWNIFERENDFESPMPPHLISLNVLFKIGNDNERLEPIIKGLQQMGKKDTIVSLKGTFGPYDFFPTESSFYVYNARKFPLWNADAFHMHDGCSPSIRVYVFNVTLTLSQKQLSELLKEKPSKNTELPKTPDNKDNLARYSITSKIEMQMERLLSKKPGQSEEKEEELRPGDDPQGRKFYLLKKYLAGHDEKPTIPLECHIFKKMEEIIKRNSGFKNFLSFILLVPVFLLILNY